MTRSEKIIGSISRLMARIGGVLLTAAAVLVAVEVVCRYTQLLTFSFGTELSTYALAIGATWSLAHAVFERAHVRVDVVCRRFPDLPRAAFDVLAMAALVVVGLVLTFGALEMTQTSFGLSSKANTTLGTPIALPQGAWTFGLVWFTFVAAYRTVCAGMALLRRDFAETYRIAASPSQDDEVQEAISETDQYLDKKEATP